MTKKKKIIFSVIAILVLIYFLPIFGLEKSVIKNKIAKSTREPVLGKNPLTNFAKELIVNKKIDFVDEKNVSHYVKDKDIEKLKQENSNVIILRNLDYSDIDISDIKKLGYDNEIYYKYIQSDGDAIYFKPDFSKLFKKKVGDKVSLIIDNEEYTGFITKASIKNSRSNNIKEELLGEINIDSVDYDFQISPTMEKCREIDINDCGINIDISGSIYNNGESLFFGSIDYSEINGGMDYSFMTNENLGILVSKKDFEKFLGHKTFD